MVGVARIELARPAMTMQSPRVSSRRSSANASGAGHTKRVEARQDVFDFIEMFYHPVRKQVRNGTLSPVEFEQQQFLKAEDV